MHRTTTTLMDIPSNNDLLIDSPLNNDYPDRQCIEQRLYRLTRVTITLTDIPSSNNGILIDSPLNNDYPD